MIWKADPIECVLVDFCGNIRYDVPIMREQSIELLKNIAEVQATAENKFISSNRRNALTQL